MIMEVIGIMEMEVLMQEWEKEMLVLITIRIIMMNVGRIVGIKGLIWERCFHKENNMRKVKGMG
jgi:hypothetical protein